LYKRNIKQMSRINVNVKPYMECISKKCKSVDNAISFAKTGSDIISQLGKKGTPTKEDLEKIRNFAKHIRKHKVNIKDAKCSLEKCGKEYAKMSEQSLILLADEMEKIASKIEQYIQKPGSKEISKHTMKPSTKSKASTKGKTSTKK
jgi:hypothetical protein